MACALLVTVKFYEGRYHGHGDWPPAPARLFQALMAGAARGMELPIEVRDALEWLERLPPPVIAAPRDVPGQEYTNFVPNNDVDAALSKKEYTSDVEGAVASIRTRKTIRPVLFDDAVSILYCWFFDNDRVQAEMLCRLATRLYQLGRGVDMAWANAAVLNATEAQNRLSNHSGIVHRPSVGGRAGFALLCPQSGTRDSLTTRFEKMRTRFSRGASNSKPTLVFTQPPKPRFANIVYSAPPDRLIFALRKGDVQGAGFVPWRLSESATLVTEVRDKAAQRLCATAPEQASNVERYLIGRGATEADKAARVQIVPLPSIGHTHADMMIRRIAIYIPQSCPLRTDDLAWAFAQVCWVDSDGVIITELQRMDDDSMLERYEYKLCCWRSVTPLALTTARRRRISPTRIKEEPKNAAERKQEEASAIRAVHQSLRHAEIDASPVSVHVQREPFDSHGKRADAFAKGVRFSRQMLWHVSMTFAEPIAGPLLLGDGRYLGLGLMHPVEPVSGVLAFAIATGLTGDAEVTDIARAARRAMMARVQNTLPRGRRIPLYVSGHQDDGSPTRGGIHRHIAVVPDLPRLRILFLAPSLLQRDGVKWQEIHNDHTLVERALEGMGELRAGKAGRLELAPSVPDVESDPLFTLSRFWESVSDYHVTRHRRRMTDDEALKADVTAELTRIGWPVPASVEAVSVRRGPRGSLSGKLRLVFAKAEKGPLVIGRTSHKGGGLFSGYLS